MLNYIWISLIALGILVAVGNDVRDEVKNTYRNGNRFGAKVEIKKTISGAVQTWEGELVIPHEAFNSFYGVQSTSTEIRQPMSISVRPDGGSSISLMIG